MAIPTALFTIATYVTVAGTVATVVSQAVVKDEDDDHDEPGGDAPALGI
ncbi:hypothetical protein [uncultured Planktosalinus sp.]